MVVCTRYKHLKNQGHFICNHRINNKMNSTNTVLWVPAVLVALLHKLLSWSACFYTKINPVTVTLRSVFSLRWFPVILQIWNHPDVLYEALQKENLASDQDLDLDDITTTGPARCPTAPNQKSKPLENPHPIGGLSLNQLQEKANQVITYEWVCWKTPMKRV